jgi:hypothetical protein
MSAPSPSPYLANLLEESAFELEGLGELLRLTSWTPEAALLESAAKTVQAVSRAVRRGPALTDSNNQRDAS